jgi:ketosteroid isomerase-like protein
MRITHLLALGAGALLATAAAAQMAASPTPEETRQALVRLECEWSRAYLHADADALRRIEADDFVYVDDDGTVLTRAQGLDEMAAGKTRFTSMQEGPMQVHLHGNTAVVTGRSVTAGTYDGHVFSGTWTWIDTWKQQPDGRWQVIGEGLAKMKQDPGAAAQPMESGWPAA